MAMSPTSPGTSISCFAFEIPDMTQPDDFSDVTLIVEERRLYTCKAILGSASPVWKRMFIGDFKEREAKEVPLPGKVFDDILDLLLCITPAVMKPVTGDNVFRILPLADEYQMLKLKQDCEKWLLLQMDGGSLDREQQLHHLTMAQKYNLEHLLDRCEEIISQLPVSELEKCPEYEGIECRTLARIFKKRALTLEKMNSKLTQSVDHWRGKYEKAQDCLMKLSREKVTIKMTLDEVDTSWEVKGPDARCIDPVHIYGPRHYGCEMCTRQLHTYLQSKVWYLLNRGVTSSGITWPQ